MIRGEPYPENFHGLRDIEKYNPTVDPVMWVNAYLLAMGFVRHNSLLAARYLPLMMEGTSRHWTQGLKARSIDSWEDMHQAFVTHFTGSCNEATNIGDLNHCVQGRNESTHKWVKR